MTPPSKPQERNIDVMVDLRERMIRIETLLEVKAKQDVDVATDLIALKLRTTAIETQALVLKAHINTLRWAGAAALAFLATFGSSLSHLFNMVTA